MVPSSFRPYIGPMKSWVVQWDQCKYPRNEPRSKHTKEIPNQMQSYSGFMTGCVFLMASDLRYPYNVEVTLAMWVSIQDLKKPLNTGFSIGPKSVTIMIPGCQYKHSVLKVRPFFQITNNYQNYHYIYIYIITICYILKYSSICYNRTTCY